MCGISNRVLTVAYANTHHAYVRLHGTAPACCETHSAPCYNWNVELIPVHTAMGSEGDILVLRAPPPWTQAVGDTGVVSTACCASRIAASCVLFNLVV